MIEPIQRFVKPYSKRQIGTAVALGLYMCLLPFFLKCEMRTPLDIVRHVYVFQTDGRVEHATIHLWKNETPIGWNSLHAKEISVCTHCVTLHVGDGDTRVFELTPTPAGWTDESGVQMRVFWNPHVRIFASSKELIATNGIVEEYLPVL